jgi:hypothetical protein
VNKTEIKKRGWTDSQIKKFLGAPDWTTQNPYYRSAAPVCNYDDGRVIAIEASPKFAESKQASAGRRAGASKAVETKRQKLQDYLDNLEIVVPEMDDDKLIELACESYNDRQRDNLDWMGATPKSDPEFLSRIAVNYLRHEMSSYEETLDSIAGKAGAKDAYLTVKDMVLDAIADAYPNLADECYRQSNRAHEIYA